MKQCPVVQFPDGSTGIVACALWPITGATDMRATGVIGGVIGVIFISSCCIESCGIDIAAAICMGQKLPSSRVMIYPVDNSILMLI